MLENKAKLTRTTEIRAVKIWFIAVALICIVSIAINLKTIHVAKSSTASILDYDPHGPDTGLVYWPVADGIVVGCAVDGEPLVTVAMGLERMGLMREQLAEEILRVEGGEHKDH